MQNDPNSTKARKAAMIQALTKCMGVVTAACKMVGIDRRIHYTWLKRDSKYSEAVESIADIALDFAEAKILENIKAGDVASIIFYLKTKGKHRGYTENKPPNEPAALPPTIDWWSKPENETATGDFSYEEATRSLPGSAEE